MLLIIIKAVMHSLIFIFGTLFLWVLWCVHCLFNFILKPPLSKQEVIARLRVAHLHSECPQGIPNRGSTCYLDTALQGLVATNAFVEACIAAYETNDTAICGELCRFFDSYFVGGSGNTAALSQILAEKNQNARVGNQYDTYYILSEMFNRLKTELPGSKNPVTRCFGLDAVHSTKCRICGVVKWNSQPNFAISLELLDGSSSSSAGSCECLQSAPGRRDMAFQINGPREKYSVPNKPSTMSQNQDGTIGSVILGAFMPYNVKGYECRTCGAVGSVVQEQFLLDPLPPYVILYLKRYHNIQGGDWAVDTRTIYNEKEIGFGGYVILAEGHEFRSEEYKYELYAVVVYRGNLKSGHYFAYVKWGAQWYRANDSTISKVGYDEVSVAPAALLFYKKKGEKNTQEDRREGEAPSLTRSQADY